MCFDLISFKKRFLEAAKLMELSQSDMILLNNNYVYEVDKLARDLRCVKLWYFVLTNTYSIGGIITTSILSVYGLSTLPAATSTALFWTTWVLSILVLVSNKLSRVFSLDRKYVILENKLNNLQLEGWRFISRVGKYSITASTHHAFLLFCRRINKIQSQKLAIGNFENNSPRSDLSPSAATDPPLDGIDPSRGPLSTRTDSFRYTLPTTAAK